MVARRTKDQVETSLGETLRRATRALLVYALIFALAWPSSLFLESVTVAARAQAQSYSTGYAKYQKGDFQGAEKALSLALRGNLAKPERAKTLKLLGICQFMLNNKAAAANSFKQALQTNPATSIGASEVLDEGVIPFFNGIKGKSARTTAAAKPMPKKKAPPPAKAPAKAPAAIAKAPAPAPAPAAEQKSATGGTKPLKKTFLKVLSNVANATISIDGIIAGQTNNLINLDPGKVAIEVTSAGYLTKTVTVNIVKDQENAVTVDLEKPKPKPKPQPKPKPKAKPQAEPQSEPGETAIASFDELAPQKQRAPKKKGAHKVKKKKKGQGDLFAPTPDDEMFYDQGGGGGRGGGGGGRGGRGGGGGGRGGADLANEFDMDSATGGYGGGYGGGYAAPPGAPQPYGYAVPPPMYYAPPPVYYAPPSPPPPPAPEGGGYDQYAAGAGGYPDPAGADPAAAAPPSVAPVEGGAPASATGGGGGSGNSMLIALLPFGAGQYQNKSYVLSLFFAGSELAALYYYKSKSDAADKVVAETNAYTAQQDTSSMSDEDRQAFNTFLAQRQKYVSDTRKAAQMGIAAFIGLWVVGAAEAIINEPALGAATKEKKAKKRKYAGFASLGLPLAPDDGAGMMALAPSAAYSSLELEQPSFVVEPTSTPSLSLGLKVNF